MRGVEKGGRPMKKAFLLSVMVSVLVLAGTSWADVFDVDTAAELRTALTNAAGNGENDTINIAAGTYSVGVSTFSYTPSLGPPEENFSLTIVGAGTGSTILDGGNTEQIMHIDTTGLSGDANADITVTGITFWRGNDTTAIPGQAGGLWVWTSQADITVENCEFLENTGYHGGGARAISTAAFPPSGNVTFRNNVFRDNIADNRGGGAYGSCSSGTLTYMNNLFDGNTADFNGGGALGNTSDGAVIYINNVFTRNTATIHAGGGAKSYASTGTITFTNNSFSGNTAGQYGGGHYISLYKETATANIYNNIAWSNTTAASGNDIYVEDDGDGDGALIATVNLYNNNYGPGANDFEIEVGGATFHSGDNITTDPLFVDVSDPDPSNWDLHIKSGSPCRDSGTASAPALPATDVDGEPRTAGSAPDIGADEFPVSPPVSPLGGGGGGCFIETAGQ